jgi:hypothetical protein
MQSLHVNPFDESIGFSFDVAIKSFVCDGEASDRGPIVCCQRGEPTRRKIVTTKCNAPLDQRENSM